MFFLNWYNHLNFSFYVLRQCISKLDDSKMRSLQMFSARAIGPWKSDRAIKKLCTHVCKVFTTNGVGLLEQKSKLCIGAEWCSCSSLPLCGKGQQDLQHSLASMWILWSPQIPAQGFSLEG